MWGQRHIWPATMTLQHKNAGKNSVTFQTRVFRFLQGVPWYSHETLKVDDDDDAMNTRALA